MLKLAHFAVKVSRQYGEEETAIQYLENVIEKLRASRERRVEEPILYVKMQIASLKLNRGEQKECKLLLDEGKTTLDSMTDVDPSVHASVHWVSSQYHKSRQEFADFYKTALLYLAYTSVDTLPEAFKLVMRCPLLHAYVLNISPTRQSITGVYPVLQGLAADLSLAALLGDNIYNFGELLAHPIVRDTSPSHHEVRRA